MKRSKGPSLNGLSLQKTPLPADLTARLRPLQFERSRPRLVPGIDPLHSREPSKLLRSPGQNARPVRGARMTEWIKVSIYCGTTYVHTRLSADCIERSFLVHIRDAHRVLPANVRAPIVPPPPKAPTRLL